MATETVSPLTTKAGEVADMVRELVNHVESEARDQAAKRVEAILTRTDRARPPEDRTEVLLDAMRGYKRSLNQVQALLAGARAVSGGDSDVEQIVDVASDLIEDVLNELADHTVEEAVHG